MQQLLGLGSYQTAWTPGHYMKIQQVIPLDMPAAEIRNGIPFGSAAEADTMPNSGPRQGDEVSADHQMFTVDSTSIRGDMIRGIRFNPLKTVREGAIGDHEVRIEQPAAGTYIFRYSITSGPGDWAAQHTWRSGMEFNTPLLGVVSEDDLSPKTLPDERSFLSIKGENLVVTALKKADRGP